MNFYPKLFTCNTLLPETFFLANKLPVGTHQLLSELQNQIHNLHLRLVFGPSQQVLQRTHLD